MVTQTPAAEYYLNLYLSGAIYVWGMNAPDIITSKSIMDTYEVNHTKKYDRAYYEAKLKEGYGKIGSDCSGAHHGISGYDDNAQGYFNSCISTAKTTAMSDDKVVLLFNGSSTSKITHTGVFIPGLGEFHMKSSKDNAVLEEFSSRTFKYFGYAKFINYNAEDFMLRDHYDMWIKLLQFEMNKAFEAELKVDGIFGNKTLAATDSIGLLKKGSKGVFVRLLQIFLNTKFGIQLETDGVFGKATLEQVKKFQKINGLVDDGIVGRKTWNAIKNRVTSF